MFDAMMAVFETKGSVFRVGKIRRKARMLKRSRSKLKGLEDGGFLYV